MRYEASFSRIRALGIGLGGWLVLAGAASGCYALIDTRVEFETFQQSEPLDGLAELEVDIDFTVGTLEVVEGSGDALYSLDIDYDRLHFEPDVDFSATGDRGRLRLTMESIGRGISGDQFRNALILRLNRAVTVDMRLSSGVADAELDLTGLMVRNLRISGGVGRTEVNYREASRMRGEVIEVNAGVGGVTVRGIGHARVGELRVDGGVGTTELDFGGDWGEESTRADISVGVGRVDLAVPRELSVEIQSDDSFLSDVDAPSFEREGNRYRRNVSDRPPQLLIRIESGVGGVRVDLI